MRTVWGWMFPRYAVVLFRHVRTSLRRCSSAVGATLAARAFAMPFKRSCSSRALRSIPATSSGNRSFAVTTTWNSAFAHSGDALGATTAGAVDGGALGALYAGCGTVGEGAASGAPAQSSLYTDAYGSLQRLSGRPRPSLHAPEPDSARTVLAEASTSANVVRTIRPNGFMATAWGLVAAWRLADVTATKRTIWCRPQPSTVPGIFHPPASFLPDIFRVLFRRQPRQSASRRSRPRCGPGCSPNRQDRKSLIAHPIP